MKGKLIVIEGIDGSGKNTQTIAICNYLSSLGVKNIKIHFPLYSETFFGKEVGHYLNGEFGSLESVHPKLASMLYAGDRFEKKEFIEKNLNDGAFVICDRYVPSNIAHNTVKLETEKHAEFEDWIETLEYKIFCLPKPDLVIFLDVPPSNAQDFVLMKETREYTQKKQDLHEENQKYIESVYIKFKQLSISREWEQVSCMDNSFVKPINEITQELIFILNKLL
jgi:dTMP kinase